MMRADDYARLQVLERRLAWLERKEDEGRLFSSWDAREVDALVWALNVIEQALAGDQVEASA